MKRSLFVLFLMMNIAANAQLSFVTEDLKDVRNLADSVALNAKRKYVYEKEGTPSGEPNYYMIAYSNIDDSNDKMNVVFRINRVGYNPALEIEGTKEYSFHGVSGRFLDLFPFWQKFIDNNADMELCSKQLNKATVNGLKYELYDGTPWRIVRRH